MRSARFVIGVTAACVLAACAQGESESSSDPTLPQLVSDRRLLAGEPHRFEVGTHCGVRSLGLPINDHFWITDEAVDIRDWMPEEWGDTLDRGEELLALDVELSADERTITATVAGRSVAYRPVTEADTLFDCA